MLPMHHAQMPVGCGVKCTGCGPLHPARIGENRPDTTSRRAFGRGTGCARAVKRSWRRGLNIGGAQVAGAALLGVRGRHCGGTLTFPICLPQNGNYDKSGDTMSEEEQLGLLAAGLGALIALLVDARTAISEHWVPSEPRTMELLGRLEAFLGPIAEKLGD